VIAPVLKPFPPWLLPVGGALALLGGMINTACLLSFARQPVTHITGALTMLGVAMVDMDTAVLLRVGGVLAAYFVGALIGGVIAREKTLVLSRRYAFGFLLESAALFAAMLLLEHGWTSGLFLAAFASSLQNALASTYSGALIRTTHVTGLITDLGVYLAHTLMRLPVVGFRARSAALIISCFFAGSVIGALLFRHIAYTVLVVPAGLIGLSALILLVVQSAQRAPHLSA
jgi:uncharacterized membrane protein YoaK (UPF0700 family)